MNEKYQRRGFYTLLFGGMFLGVAAAVLIGAKALFYERYPTRVPFSQVETLRAGGVEQPAGGAQTDPAFTESFLVRTTNSITGDYLYPLSITDAAIHLPQVMAQGDKILIIGHVYGSSKGRDQPTPANTLIESVETLNERSPGLVMLLGDMAYIPNEGQLAALSENFLQKQTAPVMNAIGNHDAGNDIRGYQERFGQTYFYTTFNKSRVVVLDSIVAECHIVGRQKEMLEEAVSSALADPGIEHILIFTHRVIFLVQGALAERVNGPCQASNYSELENDLLLPASAQKPVYIFAGDVGAVNNGLNLSPFYDRQDNLFKIAVGLGGGRHDKVLVASTGQTLLSFEVVSLVGSQTMSLDTYSPEYWKDFYQVD
jgi:hypothetical protein